MASSSVGLTSTGPIGLEQLNTSSYVWGVASGIGYATIQQAVDSVRTLYGAGEIVIIHGHTYGENIGAITGGNTEIILLDKRDGTDQRWTWNGTQYVPRDFTQLAGFVAEGMPTKTPASTIMGFDPTGDNGRGTGHLTVSANASQPMPALNISLQPENGDPLRTYMRCDMDAAENPRIQIPAAIEVYSDPAFPGKFNMWVGESVDFTGSKGMYIWAKPDEDAIDFQGETVTGTFDQTIRLNLLGGDVILGMNAAITEAGELSCEAANVAGNITAGAIHASDAVFETCEVDNSPVRTFANTADGPSQGMIWPEFGIPVSEGDHWRDPSIDPATLATYPAVGIAVSTGTAWTFSIDPATIPRLNMANVFTGLNTIASLHVTQAFQATMNNGSQPPVVSPSSGGFALGWNSRAGNGETDFINSNGGIGGGFNWYNVGGGTSIGPATPLSMSLDSSNKLHVTNGLQVAGNIGTIDVTTPGLVMGMRGDGLGSQLAFIDSGAANDRLWMIEGFGNAMQFSAFSDDQATKNVWMQVDRIGVVPTKITTIAPLSSASVFMATYNMGGGVTASSQGVTIGWNLSNANGETDFINAAGGGAGGFAWHNVSSNAVLTSAAVPEMKLDSTGALTIMPVAGGYHCGPLTPGGASAVGIDYNTALRIICCHPTDTAHCGQINLWGYSSDFSQSVLYLNTGDDASNGRFVSLNNSTLFTCGGGLLIGLRGTPTLTSNTHPNINSDGGSVIINPASGGGINFNWDRSGTVYFGNGSGGSVGSIDPAGNAHFNGSVTGGNINAVGFFSSGVTNTIGKLSMDSGGGTFNGNCVASGFYTSGAKAFRITHPLDDEKQLTHCCIEGPEIAVFYRGEAVTKDGVVAVTLPDYFEALTRKEGRTIQLTELYDDEKDPMFGNFLAAGRIVNGKFNVRTSSNVAVKLYWEVKAVRADISPLEVTTTKEKPIDPEPPTAASPKDTGADRDGTPEAREPKSKKVRA